MKNNLPTKWTLLLSGVIACCLFTTGLQAQTFPTPTGFTLPNGKTIVITYDVDVNANACTPGTLAPANLSNQSNVSGTNFATVQTDDPDIAGSPGPTLTPFSSLTLGNLVYKDANNNGVFDAGDVGVNGVLLRVYVDDGDGVLTVADGAALTTATTAGGGLYTFTNLCPGNYIVEVAASNFNPGGPLYDNALTAALISSPVGGAPDPDNDVNNDDNGDPVAGFGVASQAITLSYGGEPVNDGDTDNNTNLSLDFGFKNPTTVTINDVTLNEGTGGGTTSFNFTVTRSIPDEAFSLTVNTADGTAVSPSDFTAISGGTVSFTAGGALTQTVTVLVNQDAMVEANETFTVLLSGAPAGIIISDGSGLGTITNDDNATVTLSGGIAQNEGNAGTTSYTFTATLNNPVQGGFSVAYATNNGTATTADNDYVDNDGTLAFTGTAGETKTFTVLVNGDLKVEANETFTTTLGAFSGTALGASITTAGSPQTGTITNDDNATVTLSGGIAQNEGNAGTTSYTFTATLNNPVQGGFSVAYTTNDGTATTADNDYVDNDGTLAFTGTAGETKTFTVLVNGDLKVEANETFTTALGAISGTALGASITTSGSPQTATITNDDSATLTLSGGIAQNEGNSGTTPYIFTVTLNNAVAGGFTANYSTNDGTATTADNDYVDNDGTLTFTGTAGETKTFTVLVNGDLNIEANETFQTAINSLSGVVNPGSVTIAGSPQTATITNDEQDWGDAPTAAQSGFLYNYPTLLVSNGARHAAALGGLHLGATIDAEADGQPNVTATGDDGDEDGVILPASLITGTMATITVNASGPGKLDGWVDFNRNGRWADTLLSVEQVFNSVNLVAGNNTLTFAVPVSGGTGSQLGTSFARFRISTAGGLTVRGLAADGEVEDYQVNILNNQFSIDNPSVVEGNAGTTNLVYTVSRSTNATASSVDYAITGGTATSGSDYAPLAAGTINFTAGGALTQTITVTVNGDLVVESNETVIITLSNPVNGGIGANPGTGTITNDDAASLTLSGGVAQNEGNAGTTAYTFTVTLNPTVQGGFTVPYTTNDGTATTVDNDYVDNDGTLTFAGTAGETKTITVLVNGDTKVELNETFTVALGALVGAPAGVTVAGSPQTGTITNDDAAVVSIAGNVSQAENLTPQVFTVNLSNPVDVPVTVQFSTSDGTATTADNDYTGIAGQTVTFTAGTTTAQSVNVTIINDSKVEANEVYNVAIGTLNASGRNVSLGTSTGTGTIVNDDAATVTLSGGTSHNEGNTGTTSYTFTATLNAAVQGGFTANYTTNDGTATTADADYADNDGVLTFTGTAGETKTITVLVNGDLNIEADETFTVALNSLSGVVNPGAVTIVGSPQTGTIINDEKDWGDAPSAAQSGLAGTYPTLSADNGAYHPATPTSPRLGATIDADLDGQPNATATGDGADEDGVTLPGGLVINTSANITVNASAASFLDAWVDWNRDGDWNDVGENIFFGTPMNAGNNALSFAVPGGASLGISFARFRLSTSSVGSAPFGPGAPGEVEDYQVNIVNNQFSINSPSVVEGNAGTSNLTFTISRTTNVTSASVDYAITGGTATSGSDYAPLAAGTASFTAGGALSQTITVLVNGDLVVENNETVIITLSNPVNGGISIPTGTGTIVNDDAAVVTLAGGIAQNEGNAGTTTYTFTATLNAAVQGGFTVPYTTNDGTATTADNDYTDNDGTLSFTGTIGETKTITVLVNGDIKVELNEAFTVALGALVGAPAGVTVAGSPQTGTITNDDAATISIAADVSQAEAITPQTFSVTLSNPVDVAVTVQFNTADGTATTADNDYTGITNQTVTFAAGTTTAQSVPVTIINDNKVENNETYTVTISGLAASGRNVSLGTPTRTGTIINDDAATVTLTPAGGITQNEGNTGTVLYQFFATLNNPVQGSFIVNYTSDDGTATAGSDYINNDGIVSFSGVAGQSQPISILVFGDNVVEPNETFTVSLNSISGAPAGVTIAGSPQTGTILNDEVDYGDAPDTYATLLASNGARHNTVFGFQLGATIDGENDGQPNASATGDGADEDGVTLPNPLVTNTTASVTVNASQAGKIDAWVDFNNNGSFADAGEKVFNNVAVVSGNNTLTFAVPNGATPSNTFARFRLSSAGGLSFNGAAADGEVEDYAVQIVNTQFTINDPTVVEGNAGTSNLVFTVTRSNNASACSVNYAITGGTATTADNDYQPLAPGTVTFTAGGALTATITVLVNGDTKVELNETVDITLSAPVNGTILDGSGTGTITNDDAATITINNPTVTEGDTPNTTTMTFTISMSNPSDANVSVNYTTVDGTATIANNDYQAASGTKTFTPGQQSQTVVVTVVGDCAIEPNETLILRLSGLVNNGRNVSLSGGGATLDGTGTITNDDAVPIITCPGNLTVNNTPNLCSASVTLPLPTLTSICGASTLEFHYRTVNASNTPTGAYNAFAPAANNTVVFPVGRYEVEFRITDGSGTASCSYILAVVDSQLPNAICQNIMANLDANGTVTITPAQINNGSTDNCGIINMTLSQYTFTCANVGSNIVFLNVIDASGNKGVCTATVTVKDLIAPTALCKNVTVNLGANGTVTVTPAQVNNGSSDNCGATLTLTLTPNTFTCANVGNTTVTLKATDASNNMSTCTAVVTVKDLTAPTALCKSINVFLDNTGHASITAADVNNGSTDNCSITSMTINNSQFDCGQIGGTPQVVVLTLKDQANNTSSCTAYVTVKDAIAPTAVCQDVTVQLDNKGRVTVYPSTLAAGSFDNCSVWSYSPTAKLYTCANLGTNALVITVKDFSGNGATCTSQVTVVPGPSTACFTGQNPDALTVPDNGGSDLLSDEVLSLQIYPNPTVGQVTVQFDLPTDQTYRLRLFDLTGRLILHQEASGRAGDNTLLLPLGDQPSGLYLLEVQTDTQKAQQRLVIQRD